MAWTKTSAEGRGIATETITLGNIATVYSSVMDFIGVDDDFLVYGNVAATNTAGANTTEVQASFDKVTWVTVTSSFMADFDTATKVSLYDNSVKGDAPYYRIAITAAANDSANTAKFVVIY